MLVLGQAHSNLQWCMVCLFSKAVARILNACIVTCAVVMAAMVVLIGHNIVTCTCDGGGGGGV